MYVDRYFGGGSIKLLTMLELHSSMYPVCLCNHYYACPMLLNVDVKQFVNLIKLTYCTMRITQS